MSYKLLKHCLCCGGNRLKMVLNLGRQPLANSYVNEKSIGLEEYPLGLNVCENCWHAQLSVCVDRDLIFDNYHYASGTSKTLIRYFAWFARALKDSIPENAKVLEIAANDGSFVQELLSLGVNVTGVDPAKNIVKAANEKGIPIVHGSWPEVAKGLIGKFDAIICMNVVAHVDRPSDFIAKCKEKLNPNGFVLVQPSQARMFGNMEFDTCYHEHLSFFNTASMRALAAKCGLELFGAFLVKIHGDSPVYVLGLPDAPPEVDRVSRCFSTGEFSIAENLESYEDSIKLYCWDTYRKFEATAKHTIDTLNGVVAEHRSDGFCIAFVGAAAKAMTVINAAQVQPDYFFDEAVLKIGMYPPGMKVKVSPLSECGKLKQKTLFVLTAWNFKDELVSKIQQIGIPEGSKFYVYFPTPGFLKI